VRQEPAGGYLGRPTPSGLADVLDIVLAKGIVLDAYVRVSLVGIELLTIDARVVISSVDTYLRFAEATHRLDLWDQGGRSLPEVLTKEAGQAVKAVATTVVEHKVDNALGRVGDSLGEPAEKVARSVGGKLLDAAEGVVAKVSDALDTPSSARDG
jgi:hypothetical protein